MRQLYYQMEGLTMRQLYYQMVSRGYVPNTARDNCHKRPSGKALCGASDKCLTPSGGGPGAAPPT